MFCGQPWGHLLMRRVAAACGVIAGAIALYLSAYHYWAAGGPPTPEPARSWHEAWGNTFAIGGLLAWSAAGWGLWSTRVRRKSEA